MKRRSARSRFTFSRDRITTVGPMLIHASCAARDGDGVLLTGPPGAGKSDLLLRLLDRGYHLVADDQVEVSAGDASPPDGLAGLLEVRGLGIVRLPFVTRARLALTVALGRGDRMPAPRRDAHGLPEIMIDPARPSAAQLVDLALDCALGRAVLTVGAFAS